MILTSKSVIKDTLSSKIDAIHISHHAPMSMLFSPPASPYKRQPRRRFNISLIKDKDFKDFLDKEIKECLTFNKQPSVPPETLWETMKTFLRGR